MAEYQMNRARLATAPMAIPFSVPNHQTQILLSGVVVGAPLVALAYSYAVLTFEGNVLHGGNKIEVECDGHSIIVTLNRYGQAEMSLVPFIRNAVLDSEVLDNPLYCEEGASFQQNNYRGFIDVTITEQNREPMSIRVHYIFGNYAPKGELVEDVWLDYDANGTTWANVDSAANYNANGVPVEFEDNWCDISRIVDEKPTGDFILPIDVAWYYGGDDIQFRTVNYHFRYDCRTGNVIKLRWLDANGNINTRKFTLAGRSHGGASGDSWQRPHNTKEINLGYDRGKDQWANITANETIAIGDDAIPIEHFDWIKTLASSAVVEAFMGGVWTRCNVADASVECDPRKSHFSASLTLIVPTDDVQQF